MTLTPTPPPTSTPGNPSPSSQSGMGAIPYAGGTGFRVWAPFASRVSIAGTFNNWSDTANLFASEQNGFWSVDVPGAKVGDEYKYVIVNRDTEQTYWRIDPYAKDVTSSIGNSIIVEDDFDWSSNNYQTPAWNEMVIYELHLGTFNDQPGGSPGQIRNVIEKLDYLQELGINVIQIMPFAEFSADFSWGYNPANIFAVESAYGGPRDLKELVQQAHNRGIAVIFDVVYNHLGPSDLDLWQFDGWSENGKGGIYFYNDWRSKTPWGDTRPDFGRDVIVVVNLANRSYDSYAIGFPREGYWRVRFNSDWNGYSPDFGNHPGYDTTTSPGSKDGMPFHGNIGIGPYSVLILSQDN